MLTWTDSLVMDNITCTKNLMVTVVIEIVWKKGIKTSKLFMLCLTLFDLSFLY